ncbi:TetR family transcriptional regulator [Streptomyces sp. NPDC002766]|uniref:TetR family transcriptional regulator n=1 Tax=unclassified Streptomyces TaxID=2593676 RepID=UPI003317E7E7
MRRTADQARADILKAAQQEFARYGVDGARIDRIAKQAGASKERLYTYFGDKQELFDQVIRQAVEQVHSAERIEDDDLVAYAGQLVDHFLTHPENLRMLSWTRLEEQCERALLLDTVAALQADKAEAVRRAQAAGRVDDGWDPAELLSLIMAIASYWATASGPDPASTARYRATVEEAVRRIIEPKPNP